jgi:hypothetical protein
MANVDPFVLCELVGGLCTLTPDRPARPGRRVGERGLQPAGTGNAQPVVDVAFDANTLSAVRAQVRGCAIQAGLSGDRVADVTGHP